MGRNVKKAIAGSKDRLAAMKKVAAGFASLQPASKTMTEVKAVPTCLIQFDHATRVGGMPTERFVLVHGPSSHGKTKFTLGMIRSFLSLDHFALFIDAERTTPRAWVDTMLGSWGEDRLMNHPGFLYKRPETYEQTIADVRQYCMGIAEAKDKGQLPEDTAGLIVVDSIRKLVPKKLLDQILSDTSGEKVDIAKRAGQMKAGMNANWLDELVPILERGNISMNCITREMVDPNNQNKFAIQFGTNYKLGGGDALFFDSSAVMRVERAAYVTKEAKKAEGEDKTPPVVYGERHRITIRKSKIAGKEDKVTRCYFHDSNGLWVPEGFDTARDVVELAVRFKVVEKHGAWFSAGDERIAQGEHNTVKLLTERPDWLARIAEATREKFAVNKPYEEDEDGVVS